MDKRVILAILVLTVFLVGCGNDEVTATKRTVDKVLDSTRESPTGAAVQQITEVKTEESTGTTAAEALKELQQSDIDTSTGGTAVTTIYSGTTSDKSGKDALKEKTRQAFSVGSSTGDVEADDQFGPRYQDDLPGEYGNDDSAGE